MHFAFSTCTADLRFMEDVFRRNACVFQINRVDAQRRIPQSYARDARQVCEILALHSEWWRISYRMGALLQHCMAVSRRCVRGHQMVKRRSPHVRHLDKDLPLFMRFHRISPGRLGPPRVEARQAGPATTSTTLAALRNISRSARRGYISRWIRARFRRERIARSNCVDCFSCAKVLSNVSKVLSTVLCQTRTRNRNRCRER